MISGEARTSTLCSLCSQIHVFVSFYIFFASYLLVLPKKLGSQLTTQLKRGTATAFGARQSGKRFVIDENETGRVGGALAPGSPAH